MNSNSLPRLPHRARLEGSLNIYSSPLLPFSPLPPCLPFPATPLPFSSSSLPPLSPWVSYAAWGGLKPTVFRLSLPGTFVYHHTKLETFVVQHPPEDSRAAPVAHAPLCSRLLLLGEGPAKSMLHAGVLLSRPIPKCQLLIGNSCLCGFFWASDSCLCREMISRTNVYLDV